MRENHPEASGKVKPCKDCGMPVSQRAAKCPHCGGPTKNPRAGLFAFVACVAVIAAAIAFKPVVGGPPTNLTQQSGARAFETNATSLLHQNESTKQAVSQSESQTLPPESTDPIDLLMAQLAKYEKRLDERIKRFSLGEPLSEDEGIEFANGLGEIREKIMALPKETKEIIRVSKKMEAIIAKCKILTSGDALPDNNDSSEDFLVALKKRLQKHMDKNEFYVVGYDVQRTDSLISPYLAILDVRHPTVQEQRYEIVAAFHEKKWRVSSISRWWVYPPENGYPARTTKVERFTNETPGYYRLKAIIED